MNSSSVKGFVTYVIFVYNAVTNFNNDFVFLNRFLKNFVA